jgi:hypothetical protein
MMTISTVEFGQGCEEGNEKEVKRGQGQKKGQMFSIPYSYIIHCYSSILLFLFLFLFLLLLLHKLLLSSTFSCYSSNLFCLILLHLPFFIFFCHFSLPVFPPSLYPFLFLSSLLLSIPFLIKIKFHDEQLGPWGEKRIIPKES